MSRTTQTLHRGDRRISYEPLEQRLLLSAVSTMENRDLVAKRSAEFTQFEWQGETVRAAAGEWIVRLDGMHGAAAAQVTSAAGLMAALADERGPAPVVRRRLGMDGLFLVTTPGVSDPDQALARLSRLPGFRYAEPNGVVQLMATTPNDAQFGTQWSLNNTGQNGGTVDADIDAPEAWDITTGSGDIVVGVIDTGVDYTHPDFADNMWTNPGEVAGDGVDNDGNGYVDDIHGWDFADGDNDPMDDHNHGTAVASIIAGGNNTAGVTGLNWNAQIMALRIMNESRVAFFSDVIDAVNYATMMRRDYGVNIRVTNNSWGNYVFSQALYDAVAASAEQEILFVAAAGNGGADGVGDDNDLAVHFLPASFDLPNVIAVGATERHDSATAFSNYGLVSVDLHAPGQDVPSASFPGSDHPVSGRYRLFGGTSAATPHVVGVATLAWSRAPTASAAEIKQALLDGVDPLPGLAGKSVSGGRLNALGTLQQLGLYANLSSPSEGEVVAQPPGSFVVEFTHDVDPDSVAASDFLVNGNPANFSSIIDAHSVAFFYNNTPYAAEGPQSITLAAGAVTRLSDGSPLHGFERTFFWDSSPLTVVSSTPGSGETVTPALAHIDLILNGTCRADSMGPDDLVLSRGEVVSAEPVNATTIRYSVTGLVNEGLVYWSLRAGALRDMDGNPEMAASGHFSVDREVAPFPPLEKLAPHGGLVYRTAASGWLQNLADVDQFTINLQADQLLSGRLHGHEGQGCADGLSLVHPNGERTELSTDRSFSARTTDSGEYRFDLHYGPPCNIGAEREPHYTLEVFVNAAMDVDLDTDRAGRNDTLATAQDIDSAFVDLGRGVSRGAVVGQADYGAGGLPREREPNGIDSPNDASANFVGAGARQRLQLAVRGEIAASGDVDWFKLKTVPEGSLISLAARGALGLADGAVGLYREEGDHVVLIDARCLCEEFETVLPPHVASGGTYYAAVSGNADAVGAYELGAVLEVVGRPGSTNGDLVTEIEGNDTPLTATDVQSSWRNVRYVSTTAGFTGFQDADLMRFPFLAGDRVTINMREKGIQRNALAWDFQILDASRTPILASNIGGDGRPAQVQSWLVPESGDYFVIPTAASDFEYEFEVLLSSASAPPAPGAATPDVFSFSARQGEAISLGLVGSLTVFPKIELRDEDGLLLAASVLRSGNLSAQITDFVPTESARLYAVVTDVSGQDYRLIVTRGAGFDTEPNGPSGPTILPQALSPSGTMLGAVGRGTPPLSNEAEPNDVPAFTDFSANAALANDISGSLLPAGGRNYRAVVHGELSPPQNGVPDVDVYRFLASPGDLLTAQQQASTSNLDTLLGLYDVHGRLLSFSDDVSDSNFNSRIEFSDFPYAGEYYLIADSFFSLSTGTYDLTVTLHTLQPLGNTDDDYYRVALEAGQAYVITTATPGGALNLVNPAAELLDANQTFLATATAGAPDGRNVRFAFTPQSSGDYLIRLFAEDGHGEYILRVAPGVPGDTDEDGDVDLDDLNAVRNHFGESGQGIPGDTAPFDGQVNLDDLNAVRNHFGEGTPATFESPSLILTTLGARDIERNLKLSTDAHRDAVDRVLEETIWLRYQDAVNVAPFLPMKPRFARSRCAGVAVKLA